MWGADAGQLLALAARLDRQADEIDRAQRALTGRLRSAPWQGPGADRYRQRWESARPAAGDRGGRVPADSARELRTNAAQQQEASGQGGATGGIGTRVLDSLGIAWGTLSGAAERWGSIAAPILGLGTLTTAAATVGRYTNAYRPLLGAGDWMRYKQSPILQSIKSWGGAAGSRGGWVSQTLNNPVFKGVNAFAGRVNQVSRGIDAAGTLVDLATGRQTVDGGDITRAAADVSASGLKATKNPVAYLAGVNVSIWSDVVETGVDAVQSGDFTLRGIPSPFSKESFTQVYAPAARDVGSQLIGFAKGWF